MNSTKTIIITGASDGIGKSIALELSSEKYGLILLGRSEQKLSEVKKECMALGATSVETFAFDISNTKEIASFVSNLRNKEIYGLINNAGIWQKKSELEQIPEEDVLNIINTNLTGLILLTQKLLPSIKKSTSGFIVNVSSRSGYSAQAGQSVYSATKYGVRGFTEVLREDLASTKIRVSGIYQGGTNTQMFNKAGESFSDEKLSTFIPTEELAKVISFLISRPEGIWLPEIKIENK